MIPQAAAELAATAARLVVEEGMEYGPAKSKAARMLERQGLRRPELPDNLAVEDEVRAYLALFHGDTQPAELAVLRRVALQWMTRLAAFRPHLAGAAWRGTATRRSALHIELFSDDPKSPEIELINLGVDYDVQSVPGRGEPRSVLSVAARCPDWPEPVTVFLSVCDHDELRGALKPDAAGRTWRGDLQALQLLMEAR